MSFTAEQQRLNQQHHLLREQDESLSEIGTSLTRMKEVGIEINGELESQNLILSKYLDYSDSTKGDLKRVATSVKEVQQSKGRTHLYVTILILGGVLMLLIVFHEALVNLRAN